jgi:hypothetical protein
VLEVFNPVPWADFCTHYIDRLSPEDLARGVIIRFRWVNQRLCVTAVGMPTEAVQLQDPAAALDLHTTGSTAAALWAQIRAYAEAEVQRQHALHPFYQRVSEHGRVHLARPFRSTALCKKRAPHWDNAAGQDMTCRVCIRRAAAGVDDFAFKHITVSQAERVRARLRVTPDPMLDLVRSVLNDTLARRRGGGSPKCRVTLAR